MSFLALAESALVLGFFHGLGADHLMAIAALAVDGSPERRHVRAFRTAIGFACGHAMLLGAGAILAVTFGLLVPAVVSTGAERAGGLLLVAIGAFGGWSLATGRTYAHVHGPRGALNTGGRWHLHLSRDGGHPAATHGGSVVPVLLGALFAVSSLRAVMLLQPFSPDARTLALPGLLVLIALFGVGILISMTLFGVVLARVLSTRTVTALGKAAAATVAAASVALGLYWILA
jgi:nickel/cobalt exporter